MKQLKQIRYVLYLLLAGWGLIACVEADVDRHQPDEELSAIRFGMPQLGSVVMSRADAASETLPEGATMRVVAYRRSTPVSEAEVDFQTATPDAELTCMVASDGNLIPWALDDRGVITGAEESGEVMYLRKGLYDFYAVSPGYKPQKDPGWKVMGIPHRTDVMTSYRMGVSVDGKSETPVDLEIFNRQCTQIVFMVRPEEKATDITHLKGTSLKLCYLSTAPGSLPVKKNGVIPPTCAYRSDDPAGQLSFSTADFMDVEPVSPVSNKVKAVILPKSTSFAGVMLNIEVERDNEKATLSAQMENMAFEAGKSYVFMLTVGSNNSGALELVVLPWKSHSLKDDQVGTPDDPSGSTDPDVPEWSTGTGITVAKWNDIIWTDNNVGGGGSVEVPGITLPAEAGVTRTIDIMETGIWDFYKAAWFNVTGTNITTNGNVVSGSGTVNATVTTSSVNPSAEARSFKIMLPGMTIPVTQEGAVLKRVYPFGNIRLGAAASSSNFAPFEGTAGLYLSHIVSSGCDWLTVSGYPSISESSTMSIVANASRVNSSSTPRYTAIYMRGGNTVEPLGPYIEFPVEQEGATLSVTNTSVLATVSSNNKATINGTTGLSWQTSSNESWITTSSSGLFPSSGSSSVNFNVTDVNPNESLRTGTITVKAGDGISKGDAGLIKQLQVTQSASTLNVSASNTSFANTGGSGTLTISGTTGLSYSTSADSWIYLSSTPSGVINGAKTCNYKATATNPNPNSRQGNILVKAGNITKKISISQAASVFDIINKSGYSILASGGSATLGVNLTEGLSWTIEKVSGSSVFSLDRWSSSTSQSVTFSASANGTGSIRIATYRIYVNENPFWSYTIQITQESKPIRNTVGDYVIERVSSERQMSHFPYMYCESSDGWVLPSRSQLDLFAQNASSLDAEYRLSNSSYWTSEKTTTPVATGTWSHQFYFYPSGYITVTSNSPYGEDKEVENHAVRCIRKWR